MIIICETHASDLQIDTIEKKIRKAGLDIHRSQGVDYTVLGVVGDLVKIDRAEFKVLPGVRDVVSVGVPYKRASRDFHPEDTIVHVCDVPVGGREVVLMSGPCAVESEQQIMETAQAVAGCGGKILRGAAYRPKTSPYTFQGLGKEGLVLLRKAADKYDLAVSTEVISIEYIDLISEYADLLQVSSDNMLNIPLLTALGERDKPVMLKRGLSATIEDWLMSAEFILAAGNNDVILCERGIRTFERVTCNTLDLSAVPVIKHLSHLPIIVDPSHGVGDRRFVASMARAAVAAGADGLLVETHPSPDDALSDGPQSLTFEQLSTLSNRCRIIATTIGRKISKGGR